jgi:hypothetical protein
MILKAFAAHLTWILRTFQEAPNGRRQIHLDLNQRDDMALIA